MKCTARCEEGGSRCERQPDHRGPHRHRYAAMYGDVHVEDAGMHEWVM